MGLLYRQITAPPSFLEGDNRVFLFINILILETRKLSYESTIIKGKFTFIDKVRAIFDFWRNLPVNCESPPQKLHRIAVYKSLKKAFGTSVVRITYLDYVWYQRCYKKMIQLNIIVFQNILQNKKGALTQERQYLFHMPSPMGHKTPPVLKRRRYNVVGLACL